MRLSISPTPSNTATNTPTITPSNTSCPILTPSITPTISRTPTLTPTITRTPTNTPSNTATITITPTNTATPSLTPTQTITPTCETFTTQYMQSAQQGNKDIRFTLFDNPDFTGNANAVCDYTITGTFDIDGGAINQPYTTIMAQNDHNHTYNTGSNITGFTITSVVPVCPCVLVIFNQITPTPTLTPTNTPTNTQTSTPTITPTNTPSITPTQTPSNTPTMTPTTPELCECWEIVNTDGIDISMRYYNCQGAEDCVIIDATSSRIVCISANTDTLIIVSSGTTCGGGAPPSYTWNPLGSNCTFDNDCFNPPPSSTPTSTNTSTPEITPTNTNTPTRTPENTPTITPTSTQTCCAIEILTNNSLDVDITAVDVDGSAATYVGGQPLPNEPGSGTSLCSTNTGTVDIRVSVFNSVAGQKITLCDSNGTCVCQNITGTGPSNYDWLDVVFNCETAITILAEDGSC
jgi:hypothetical protein